MLGVRASRAVDASACPERSCVRGVRFEVLRRLPACRTNRRAPFHQAIEIAEAQTGENVHFDREIPEYVPPVEAVVDDEFDRRAAFDSVKDDAFDIISGRRRLRQSDTLKEAYRKKERGRMREALNLSEGEYLSDALEKGRATRVMPPRRRMLLEPMPLSPTLPKMSKLP